MTVLIAISRSGKLWLALESCGHEGLMRCEFRNLCCHKFRHLDAHSDSNLEEDSGLRYIWSRSKPGAFG